MNELFWWEAAALFWAALCFFRAGAAGKALPMTRRVWWEVVQAALIVVLLFALLSEGRGCRLTGSSATPECIDDSSSTAAGGGC